MRLVDGPNLGALIERGGPLSPERAVGLVSQIAEALDAAHADGVVHRDVKPSNVLVTANDFVYVADFGIAHAVGHNRSKLTMTGATIGTLDYMAPERFESHPVDPRTDVYSLACVLFECLTAEKPFLGDDLPALMYAHLYTAPRKVSAVNPAVGTELDAVVAKGMAKNPADRYPSTGALAAAARAAISTPGDQTEQHVEEITRRVEAPSESETVIARPLVGAPAGVGAAMAAGGITEPPGPGYAEPRYDDPTGPRYAEPQHDDATRPAYAEPHYDDGRRPAYAEPRYDDAAGPGYGEPRYDDPAGPRYAEARHDDPGAAPTVGVPIEYPRAAGPPPGPPQPPFGPGGPPPEPPRKGGRARFIALLAVIALLVAGAAAGAIWFLSRGSAPAPSPEPPPPAGAAPSGPVGPAIIAPPAASVGRSVDTPTVGQTVPANSTPGYMEIAPSGRFAYIANRELGVLSIFDTTRNAVTGTIKVPEGGPQFVAFAPDGKRAYVSIFNNARTVNVVGVLDTATNAFIATIPVGVRPVRARRHAGRQEGLRAQPRLRVDHRDRHGDERRGQHDQGGAEPALGGRLRRRQDAVRGEPRVERGLDDRHDQRQGDHDRAGGAVAAQHPAPPNEAVAVQRELRQQLHERDRHQLEQGHQDHPDGQPPAGHHAVRRRRAHLHRRGRRQRHPGVQHEDHGHRVAGAGGQGTRRASR